MSQLEIEKIISERNEWLAKQSIQDWNDEDTKHVVNAVLTSERQKVKGLLAGYRDILQLTENIKEDSAINLIREISKNTLVNYNNKH